MNRLKDFYREGAGLNIITIGLGDSPNDQGMLNAVDIAVIIRSDRSEKIQLQKPGKIIRTTLRGPDGWQEAMDRILPDYLEIKTK